jgi:NAD(P)-dependent dehydrogenase (short-subunit alcohol dehydrogenase family)
MSVAAITGGRGAIGSAVARRLREDGWAVVTLDLPSTSPDVVLDTTDPDTVAAAFAEVRRRHGRLDLLVVAAGITALGRFDDTDDATFRRLMDVNFHGAVACLRAALPDLGASSGRVVVLSSVAGLAPVVGRPAYVASKHALTGTFEALRAELATDGIGVTMVHPTFVTNELADVAGGTRSTTGALVTPADVADAIVDAVASDRERVLPGRTARLADFVHRLSPRLYRRIMTRRLAD